MNEHLPINTAQSEPTDKPLVRELTETNVDQGLSQPLRVQKSIGDPYHFNVCGTEVRISFVGTNSINIQLACALSAMADIQ